jgi:nicotinamidase-related amidase/type 1 glutamine amidotransferase
MVKKLASLVPMFGCMAMFVSTSSASGKNANKTIELELQRRDPASGTLAVKRETIDAAKTAIVVIDMWDRHWCKTYTKRVGNMAPRMNQTLEAARKLGIQVVHAPSDVSDFYKDYPQRKAMQAIPSHQFPQRVAFNPPAEPEGKDCCECGPDQRCKSKSFGHWSRQHPDLKITEGDLIGDCNNESELLNLCQEHGIDTLIYMGVASNMCVLHRQFGMLNMRRRGLNVIFVSDLVQAITANGLDPARKTPDLNFTPAKGSAIVQRYLEQHIAPSFESRQLIAAAGMEPFAEDKRPHIVFVMAEEEYKSNETLPAFAKKYLFEDFRCTFLHAKSDEGEGRNDVPGLEAMYDADLLVLSMRRRALPVVQMDHLEHYIRSGKPMVCIRVSVVPFQVNPNDRPDGHVIWQDFDQEVLGCYYQGYDSGSRETGCDVWVAPEAKDHPILHGIETKGFHSESWLYRLNPLADSTTLLVKGRWSKDHPEEPVAFTNTYQGGRVFYTSLGHPDDFNNNSFCKLLVNAVFWATGKPPIPDR